MLALALRHDRKRRRRGVPEFAIDVLRQAQLGERFPWLSPAKTQDHKLLRAFSSAVREHLAFREVELVDRSARLDRPRLTFESFSISALPISRATSTPDGVAGYRGSYAVKASQQPNRVTAPAPGCSRRSPGAGPTQYSWPTRFRPDSFRQ